MNPSRKERKARVGQTNEPLCLFYFANKDDSEIRSKKDTSRTFYLSSTKRSKPTKTETCMLRLAARNIASSSGDTDATEKPRKAPLRSRRRKDGIREPKRKVRGFGRDTPHHLTSYLLSSVKTSQIPPADQLPPLTDVLTTIQDAWPTQNLHLGSCEKHGDERLKSEEKEKATMSQSTILPAVPLKLVRRRSVPEEIIRKYSVSKEQTSESETNATMPEGASSSGKEVEEAKGRVSTQHQERPVTKSDRMRASFFAQQVEEQSREQDEWINKSFKIMNEPERSEEEGSSDSDSDAPGLQRFNTIKRAPLRREPGLEDSTNTDPLERKTLQQESIAIRVSQKDYDRRGQGILKPRVSEKYSQTGECSCRSARNDSETTPSAQEETDSAESSESISSPTLCARPLTSSENQSSDSEGIPCTCAELTSSKDTSTDPYHSGKSTLSQTVSDKSVSTQDSTISINSVSTQGSSISAASGTSSPDIDPKTSAKETTSPDHTPRSPHGGRRSNGRRNDRNHRDNGYRSTDQRHGGGHDRTCPRYCPSNPFRGSRNYTQNAEHKQSSLNVNCSTEERSLTLQKKTREEQTQTPKTQPTDMRIYEWATKSTEETNIRQQQLRTRFIENNRQFETPVEGTPMIASGTVSMCTGVGTAYQSTQNLEGLPLMVPRYSALPRSLSMVVNTSSLEMSHNSDSESIADSLEDDRNEKITSYFDTKHESKPVRGDVNQSLTEKNRKWKYKLPRGKAYFVSIDNGGEEIVTDIYKIPEPPDKIKSNIYERHASICKNRQSREKMHQDNALPTARPTFTKRIRRERKLKQKEQLEAKKEKKTPKKESSRGRRTESKSQPLVKSEAKGAKEKSEREGITDKNMYNIQGTETNSARIEKKTLSKIPILVKSASTSPDRTVEVEEDNSNSLSPHKPTKETVSDEHLLAPPKPQAVIHPSHTSSPLSQQLDLEALKRHRLSLISSLESTATILKAQQQSMAQSKQWNRNQQLGGKRPGNSKFQQKFEVIPEERSSSLSSSAEDRMTDIPEKDRRRSLPVKLTETTVNANLLTPTMEGKSFRRYSLGSLSNYVISKLMGRPLQAIPCVQRGPNNENQQIIIFSPKDSSATNSTKGRDALIAVNREDFDRLSKGWMNFYLLKEESENDIEKGDEIINTSGVKEEKECGNLFLKQEDKLSPTGNTIVCRIPSMEKDPATSGSGTDETSTSPKHLPQPPSLDNEQFKKKYSLLLRDTGTDCFELQEYIEQKRSNEGLNNHNVNHQSSSSGTNEHSMLIQTSTDYENDAFNEEDKKKLKRFREADTVSIDNTTSTKEESLTDTDTAVKTTKDVPSAGKQHLRSLNHRNEGLKLSDDIKFCSSNTVLRSTKLIQVSPKKMKSVRSSRGFSLPELPTEPKKNTSQPKTRSVVESLPRLSGTSGSEDMDSDSTVYMQAPSPQVPPLPLDGVCDCLSDSISSSEDDERMNAPPAKASCFSSNPARPRHRPPAYDTKHSHKSGKSGWSVTVAGPVAFPDNTPDVQMRLSFPAGGGPPLVSQSDSGFAEERLGRSKATSLRKQEWTVTVKNPRAGRTKEKCKTVLPNVSTRASERNTKRVPKAQADEIEIESIVRKIPQIWSKVQEIIEEELKQWKCDDDQEQQWESNLLVSGRAVAFDTKPKPTKMSDRDVTRNTTARTNSVQRSSLAQE